MLKSPSADPSIHGLSDQNPQLPGMHANTMNMKCSEKAIDQGEKTMGNT
jgi:hypothetical protein